MWPTNRSVGTARWDKNTRLKLGTFRRHSIRGGRDEKAYLVGLIDGYVKLIFREHTQEVDHLANLVTKVQKQITIEGVKNNEKVDCNAKLLGW